MYQSHAAKRSALKKNAEHLIKDVLEKSFTSIAMDDSVQEAIRKVRTSVQKGDIFYLYVVDEHDRLSGVLSIRNLLLAKDSAKVKDIYTPTAVFLQEDMLVKEAYAVFSKSRFLSLPVVDIRGHIVGVLHAHDLVEEYEKSKDQLFEERSRGELYDLLGIKGEDSSLSLSKTFLNRLPWLLVNVLGGTLSVFFIHNLSAGLKGAVTYLAFVPIILIISESVGMQTASIVISQLHKLKAPRRKLRIAWRELGIALLLGASISILLSSGVHLWQQDWQLTLTVFLTTLLGPLWVAFLGNLIPQVFNSLRFDARVAAGPVVLTLADCSTLVLYLLIALLLSQFVI